MPNAALRRSLHVAELLQFVGIARVCAHVVDISLDGAGGLKVHRVTCAVDPCYVVNPRIVSAQIEGAVAYGLSAALSGEITFDRGRAQQSNFHDYPVLRMTAFQVPHSVLTIVGMGFTRCYVAALYRKCYRWHFSSAGGPVKNARKPA